MIIWTGRGIVTLMLVGAAFGILSTFDIRDENAEFAYSLFIAAPFAFILGRIWNRPRLGIDEETNEEVIWQPNHTLFWIPMQYWSIIFVIIGIIILIAG